MSNKRLQVLILLALLSFSTFTCAREVKMATTNWPPFYGESLVNGGPLTEIVSEAFRRMGHTSSVEFLPWSRARRKVLIGESEIILGAYFSEQRAKKHHFSDAVMMVDVGLVARKELGITSFKNLRELTPHTIGVSKGWINNAEFDAANFLSKDIATNQVLNIRKLAHNRVDMISVSFEVFKYELAQNNLTGTLPKYVFLEPLLSRASLHLMMRKGSLDHVKIINQFNSTLKEMKKDGTYQLILKKHKIDIHSTGCP